MYGNMVNIYSSFCKYCVNFACFHTLIKLGIRILKKNTFQGISAETKVRAERNLISVETPGAGGICRWGKPDMLEK